ncbi:MAG: polymer-forming cytoskeletal protein [Pseudomonadales bacterium]
MFGINRKIKSIAGDQPTFIASGTELAGELRFSGQVAVQGVVRGNLVADQAAADASVHVMPGGKVEGDIVAPTIVIESIVEGNIYANKRVELAAGAEVCGDVHYQVIEMVQGSQVNGNLLYSPAQSSAIAGEPVDVIYQGAALASHEKAVKGSKVLRNDAKKTAELAQTTAKTEDKQNALI